MDIKILWNIQAPARVPENSIVFKQECVCLTLCFRADWTCLSGSGCGCSFGLLRYLFLSLVSEDPAHLWSSSSPGRHLIKMFDIWSIDSDCTDVSYTHISLQAPMRSSRNPTCSLSESMRSSCCRECDRKLVLSGRKLFVSPTPSKGKSVVKGARTISSFYRKEDYFIYFYIWGH